MNIGKLNLLTIGITILVFLILVSGCISPGKNVRNVSELSGASDETKDELKVSEFILGAGDSIEISVYRHDDLKKNVQINSSGMISYPLIGDIRASGLGILQLKDNIRDGLSQYIVNPQVSVNLISIQSKKYSVLGEVNRPGVFSLENSINILEATSKAEGFTIDAKLKTVLLVRRGEKAPELYTVNLERLLEDGDFAQNVNLQNGDIVYVPATNIANVSRYFSHISKILQPLMTLENAYFIGQQIEGANRATTAIPSQ
jgi:polysaccharide export outer membrane protein